ncbi:hypothetical protein [Providencia sp. PROV019]|uniref:hypothetical protein n=1 Tax=Providencia sp. PROV019 TaxID=2949754 RepID=UPI00234A9CF5|nr:hypothetical protein [Providencia sp. PROV019]
MILSLFLGALVTLILFLPTFFTIRNRGLNYKYLKKMKCKVFSFKKKKKLFLLDENSLQSQPLFWTVIALPLAVGVMLWAAVAHEYELEWSTSAYSRLMINAQFPFVMIALSPILGAFVMYGHRSLQTFTQINATNKQIDTASKQLETARKQFEEVQRKNNVDIHIATRKYMTEQIGINFIKLEREININELYKSVFLKKGFYIYEINSDFHQKTCVYLNDITEHIKFISSLEQDDFLKKTADDDVIKFVENLTGKSYNKVYHFGIMYNGYISSLNEMFNRLLNHFSFIIINVVLDLFSINKKLSSYVNSSSDYYNIFDILNRNLVVWIKRIKDINEVLMQDENLDKYIPEFNELLESLNDMPSVIKSVQSFSGIKFGDKLAAENQNPPE